MTLILPWQNALDTIGPQAAHISWLWWLFLWVSAGVYLAVLASVLWASIRTPPSEPHPREVRKAGNAIVAATVVTTVILFVLLIASVAKGHAIASLRDSGALKIRVTGHQWWWEVTYEDPQPSQQFTTANEIHIPIGRTVYLVLTSNDVIHSFWAPNLNGKTDLMPGRITDTWLRADKPGIYRGQCAEFCGLQHAHMAFLIVSESEKQFSAWYARQLEPGRTPTTPEQARGRDVFVSGPCVLCHTIRGTEASARYGPDLTHIAGRLAIGAGTLPIDRGHLAGWVTNAQRAKPGNRMPPISLPPADLQALLSYLESLQ